jgi:hypothetical protein
MQLKPNSTTQFTQTLETEVLPVLRKQEGFQDEVAFIVPAERKRSQSASGSRKRTRKPTAARAIQKS